MRIGIFILGAMLLSACSVLSSPKPQTKEHRQEQILAMFNTPDGKSYFLGKQFDYEIAASDAQAIQEMLRFSKYARPQWAFDLGDGVAKETVQIKLDLPMHYKTLLPKQANLQNKELGVMNNGEFKPTTLDYLEWSERWAVKRVKVANRAAILQKSSLPQPLTADLTLTENKNGVRRAAELTGTAAVNGAATVATGTAMVVTAPIWVPMSIYYLFFSNARIGG